MLKAKALLIAALLASAVSGCNRPPAPQTASHPPAADLRCLAEPDALRDAQVLADPDGKAEDKFNDDALIAGRSCRDALRRACEWHRDRGDKLLDCSAIKPGNAALAPRERALAAQLGFAVPPVPVGGQASSRAF